MCQTTGEVELPVARCRVQLSIAQKTKTYQSRSFPLLVRAAISAIRAGDAAASPSNFFEQNWFNLDKFGWI